MKTDPVPFLSTEQKKLLDVETKKSVIVADMDGNVRAFNPGASNIFGYSMQEAIGMHVRFFHPQKNYARILPTLFRTALQKGKYDDVISLIRKDGQEFHGHIVVTQVRDDKNSIVGLLGVTEEVNEVPTKNIVQRWLQALRAPFFSAVLIPVFLGTSIAFYETGIFNFWAFFFTVFGMLFIHAGVNLANDYFDSKSGNDDANQTPTPFSGGSRVIQEQLIPANHIKYASLLCLAIGAGIGLYLNSIIPGNVILIIGLIGIFLGYFYSSPPVSASYHRFGELFVMVGFGPLTVFGSYYVQTHSFSILPIIASIPLAILIGLVLYINQFPDLDADLKVGKRNLLNTIGKQAGLTWMTNALALVFLFIIATIALGLLPLITIATLITIPLAFSALKIARENVDKVLEFLPANATIIKLHFLFGILFTICFLAGALLVG